MHNTSKSNKKGKKCDTSRTRPKAIFVVYASSLSCLVSRRLAPTVLKPFLLLWQKSKWKKYPFEKAKFLDIFKCETFLLFEGADSIETAFYQKDLLLMEQPIGYGKKKKCANGKKSFRLQMDIFCHLDFCHNRKNAFSCCCLPDFFLLVGLFDILWLRAFLKISGLCLLIIKRELHKS